MLLLFSIAETKPLPEQDVRAAVTTWVRYITADAKPDAVIKQMEPNIVNGETLAYIAHIEGGGFCLCGADDMVLPVYFYSPSGEYEPENPDIEYILQEIAKRTKILREWADKNSSEMKKYAKDFEWRSSFWKDLIAQKFPKVLELYRATLTEPALIELPLNSTWAQDHFYNNHCPPRFDYDPSPLDECLVCCVALSMAQIMYYWKWPHTGVGSGSVDYTFRYTNDTLEEPLNKNPGPDIADHWWYNRLHWTSSDGGKLQMFGYWDEDLYDAAEDADTFTNIDDHNDYLNALNNLWDRLTHFTTHSTANFAATTYQWDLMRDHTVNYTTDAEKEAVATLCHHTGISLPVSYGIRASFSNDSHIPSAMEDNFRYDNDIYYTSRDVNKMVEEIQWLRPLELSGFPPAGPGHSWVVYGYNKGTLPWQFKMNMGWNGWGVGWYSCDNVPGNYNASQNTVLRIAPEDTIRFVGATSGSNDGSPADPYYGIENAIADSADIPSNATLIFKAGSDNTFSSSSIKIDFPVILKSYDAVIRHN